jgi:hypothetical protein
MKYEIIDKKEVVSKYLDGKLDGNKEIIHIVNFEAEEFIYVDSIDLETLRSDYIVCFKAVKDKQ